MTLNLSCPSISFARLLVYLPVLTCAYLSIYIHHVLPSRMQSASATPFLLSNHAVPRQALGSSICPDIRRFTVTDVVDGRRHLRGRAPGTLC